MGVHYQADGSIELTEVNQETGDEVVGGRTVIVPPGSKEEQQAAIAAFFFGERT